MFALAGGKRVHEGRTAGETGTEVDAVLGDQTREKTIERATGAGEPRRACAMGERPGTTGDGGNAVSKPLRRRPWESDPGTGDLH